MNISKWIEAFKKYRTHDAVPPTVWEKPLHFVAFGFGSGALPYAPGTWGTFFAIPIFIVLNLFPLWCYALIVLLLTLISIWICDTVSTELKVHDHQGMCIDEFIGFFVTMMGVSVSFTSILLGFVLFRLFDIWKPYPIRRIDEKVMGGFGMILDDVVAGIYACLILHFLMRFL